MFSLTVQPEALASAAAVLNGLGSTLRSGNTLAAGPTAGVTPAAADMVSALTAAQFAAHAAMYQAVAARAAAVHDLLVATLDGSAGSYQTTEAANAVAAG
jgi:hypothetical protein